jgi:hypothetical protein
MRHARGMKAYVDWGKIIQIVLLLGATIVMAAMGVIPPETVNLVIGLGAGYVFGNGKSVAQGHGPAPAIGLKRLRDPAKPPEDET